jgi:predicted esterase YcpF (UPF0227 family)
MPKMENFENLPTRDRIELERHQLTQKLLQNQLKGNPIKEYIIPLGSLLVALLGVLSGVYAQYIASQATIRAATVTASQTGYSKILTNLDAALYEKQRGTLESKHLDNIRQAYYEVELLIPEDRRETVLRNVEESIKLISNSSQDQPGYLEQYANTRRLLRQSLQQALTK